MCHFGYFPHPFVFVKKIKKRYHQNIDIELFLLFKFPKDPVQVNKAVEEKLLEQVLPDEIGNSAFPKCKLLKDYKPHLEGR
jgi:hypothetical protein